MSTTPLISGRDSSWKPASSAPPSPTSTTASPATNWMRWSIVRWFKGRVMDPMVSILSRGVEPKQIALSTALGFTIGVFPIYGVTAVLCAAFAFLLRSRCHVPTMMLANLVATPVELSLVIPFMRFGEKVVGAPPLSIAPEALWDAVTGHGSSKLLYGMLHAILGWGIASPFITWILYNITLPIFSRMSRQLSVGASSAHSSSVGISTAPVSRMKGAQASNSYTTPLHISRRE